MKKIKYSGIPKSVLNIIVNEAYGLGNLTLKDELDKYGQDIICSRYKLTPKGQIDWFHAWTKDYALVLVYDLFDDKVILGINRNPPKELMK